jgi:hypothetical protein
VSFAAIILCVASQRVIPKVRVYFFIESVRKLLDTPSYLRRGVPSCDTVWCCGRIPTFRRTIMSTSSWWTWTMWTSETLVSYHNAEDLHLTVTYIRLLMHWEISPE